MPGSFGIFDDVVSETIRVLQPKTLLDIGAGAGKYGRMAASVSPQTKRVGIEIEPSYIEQYALNDLYHEVRQTDAATLMQTGHDEMYDLAIIGDCIEHMPKSVGLDLLNFLTYRTQYTLILSPEFCLQGSVNGVGSESHISVWSEVDFAWHDLWAFENSMAICLFLLRGYQPSTISLSQMVAKLNNAQLPVMDFYRQKTVRHAHLSIHSRLRTEVLDGVEQSFRPR